MRLVEHKLPAVGNDLAIRALADGGVSAEKMVIDDHDIGFRGALPHSGDEALLELRAFAAQAGLRRRRNLIPDATIVGQVVQLGSVTGSATSPPSSAIESSGPSPMRARA